jgi:4-amino-4-deoxy-L-arabinose transferase-like glycosyltransferase
MLFQFPLYLLGCVSIFTFFIKKRDRDAKFFLISWFAAIFLFLSLFLWCKEDRYMLLAYPAIAILSGLALVKLERALNEKLFLSGYFVSSVLIILTGLWALKLSSLFTFFSTDLMKCPF